MGRALALAVAALERPPAPAAEESAASAETTDYAVAIYLREIGRRSLLTSREERELGRCVEDGRVLEELAAQVERERTVASRRGEQAPLRLVADAFLIGRWVAVEPFEE